MAKAKSRKNPASRPPLGTAQKTTDADTQTRPGENGSNANAGGSPPAAATGPADAPVSNPADGQAPAAAAPTGAAPHNPESDAEKAQPPGDDPAAKPPADTEGERKYTVNWTLWRGKRKYEQGDSITLTPEAAKHIGIGPGRVLTEA
jgi:hypothetical protein